MKVETDNSKELKVKPEVKAKPTNHYVRNKDLLPEIIECRERGEVSDKLGRMLLLIVENYSRKYNWVNYSFKDDMKGHALVHLSNAALKFDPARSNNPFAYYTQVAKNAFIQIIKQERKQRDIKDAHKAEEGELTSWTYQDAHRAEMQAQKESREDRERAQAEYDGFVDPAKEGKEVKKEDSVDEFEEEEK